MPQTQRSYKRINVIIPIDIKIQSPENPDNYIIIQSFSKDISKGGMCLSVTNPSSLFLKLLSEENVTVSLVITLPSSYDPILAFAYVVWKKFDFSEGKNTLFLGVEYFNIIEAQRKAIFHFALMERRKPWFRFFSWIGMILLLFICMIGILSISHKSLSYKQNNKVLQQQHTHMKSKISHLEAQNEKLSKHSQELNLENKDLHRLLKKRIHNNQTLFDESFVLDLQERIQSLEYKSGQLEETKSFILQELLNERSQSWFCKITDCDTFDITKVNPTLIIKHNGKYFLVPKVSFPNTYQISYSIDNQKVILNQSDIAAIITLQFSKSPVQEETSLQQENTTPKVPKIDKEYNHVQEDISGTRQYIENIKKNILLMLPFLTQCYEEKTAWCYEDFEHHKYISLKATALYVLTLYQMDTLKILEHDTCIQQITKIITLSNHFKRIKGLWASRYLAESLENPYSHYDFIHSVLLLSSLTLFWDHLEYKTKKILKELIQDIDWDTLKDSQGFYATGLTMKGSIMSPQIIHGGYFLFLHYFESIVHQTKNIYSLETQSEQTSEQLFNPFTLYDLSFLSILLKDIYPWYYNITLDKRTQILHDDQKQCYLETQQPLWGRGAFQSQFGFENPPYTQQNSFLASFYTLLQNTDILKIRTFSDILTMINVIPEKMAGPCGYYDHFNLFSKKVTKSYSPFNIMLALIQLSDTLTPKSLSQKIKEQLQKVYNHPSQ